MQAIFLDFANGAGLPVAQAMRQVQQLEAQTGQANKQRQSTPLLRYQLAQINAETLPSLGYEYQDEGWWLQPAQARALVFPSAQTTALAAAIAARPEELVIVSKQLEREQLAATLVQETALVKELLEQGQNNGINLVFLYDTPATLLGPEGLLTRERPDLALRLGREIDPFAGAKTGSGARWALAALACNSSFYSQPEFLLTELGITAAAFDDAILAGGDAPIFAYLQFTAANPLSVDACALAAENGFRVVAIVQSGAGISRRDATGWGLSGLIVRGEQGWPNEPQLLGERIARNWLTA